MTESVVAPRGSSYFIRMYIRVEDENQFSFHSVNINSLGDVQVPLWAIFNPVAGVDYSPKLTLAHPNPSAIRDWRPRTKIRMGQWYRFEWHVEIFDVANRCWSPSLSSWRLISYWFCSAPTWAPSRPRRPR